ncbi:MAG: hypothetical protein J6M31_06755 [Bacteroidales bacterium]|nr:hypothetical protein [Bacteroidales bacterium]
MKKYFVWAFIVLASLVSCGKEVPGKPDETGEAVVFNLEAVHPDGADTKAVKTGWDNGDVIFVFFNKAAAPNYLKMTYDGSSWTSSEYAGATATPGTLGLKNGDTGTMRAVYLPFGGEETVSADGTSFVFGNTDYTYYLTATLPYTVEDNKVSGAFDMAIPEGYVQFFVEYSEPLSPAELREPHLTPQGIARIDGEGNIVTKALAHGAPLPGYVYQNGFLFSGILAEDARGVSTDYHFTWVYKNSLGFKYYSYFEKDFTGKTLHTDATHGRAVKLPNGKTGWDGIKYYKPVDIGCDVDGRRIYWASRNVGAKKDFPENYTDDGLKETWGDYYTWDGAVDIIANDDYLGSKWHLPTREEWEAIRSYNVTYEDSQKGCLLKSQDFGTQLFFPLAGRYKDVSYDYEYSPDELYKCAYYWSATFAENGMHDPMYWISANEYPWNDPTFGENTSDKRTKMSVRAVRN